MFDERIRTSKTGNYTKLWRLFQTESYHFPSRRILRPMACAPSLHYLPIPS